MEPHRLAFALLIAGYSAMISASSIGAEPTILGIGPNEESSYVGFDAWRMSNRVLPFAKTGNEKALHDFFMAAYLRASLPSTGGEDFQQMTSNFDEAAESLGDEDFAKALSCERPEVVSAVRFISSFPSGRYPQTTAILVSAPQIDFPMALAVDGKESLLSQPFENAETR